MKNKKLVFNNMLLAQARKQLGFTQVQMAKECGVASGTFQYWELGKNSPNNVGIENLLACIKAHNLPYSIKDFYSLETDENEDEPQLYIFNGRLLKKLREEKGLMQCELAEVLNLHSSTISKWERGAVFCRPKYAKEIATVFDVPDYQQFYILKEDMCSFILNQSFVTEKQFQRLKKDNVAEGDSMNDGKWKEAELKDYPDFKLLKLYFTYQKKM